MGATICGCTPVRKKRSHTVFVLLCLLLAFTSALANQMDEGFGKAIKGDVHMREFLHNQFGKVKVELTKNFLAWSGTQVNRFKRDSATSKNINVTAEVIWKSELLSSNISSVENNFFIVGDSLIQVIDDSNNSTVNTFSVKKVGITAAVISSINIKKIMFSKVFQWNGVQLFLLSTKTAGLVVLTSTTDLSNTSSSFKQQQIINHPSFRGSYAVDGEIFTHNNQLYMFLIFGSEIHEKVNAILYKWQNTYFDVEIEGVLTEGATAVSTFNYGSSVILVVIQSGLQKENAAEKISSSLVLKFSSKEKRKPSLERIHYLPTKNPLSIINFQYFGYDYILISERDTSSSIYWWEGGEFIEWLVVPQLKGMKVLVYNSTLLLAYENSVLYMYVMSWKDLERINELKFDGKIISVSVNSTRLIVLVNKNEYSEIFVVKLTMENFQDDPISNNANSSSSIIVNDSSLSKCFDNLAMELSKGQDKLNAVDKNLKTLLFTDGSATINKIKVGSKSQPTSNVTISKGHFSNIEGEFPISEDGRTSHKSLERLLNDSIVFLQRVKHKNERYYNHNFDVTFKGDLYVDKLNLNSLVARTINEQIIEPENLISLSDNQNLINVTVNSVETNWLVAESFQTKHISDLVLNNHFNNSTWSKSRNISSIGVQSLTCLNIIFNNTNDYFSINDIKLNDLVLVRNGINISRLTKFGTVEADKITLAPLDFDRFKKIFDKVMSTADEIEAGSKLAAKENLIINNLNVSRINGIQIDKEIFNLVRNGSDNIIYGDIHFMVPFKAKRSVFKHAFKSGEDGLPSASISWSVNPDSRSVYNSNAKESLRKKRVDEGAIDVDVGKRQPEELLNIFNGKLYIDGCVQVNEIVFDNCTLIIGNKIIPIMNLANEYWLHHGNQNISTVVKFNGPGGVTINNNLESISSINGINIGASQFLQIVSGHSQDIHSSISFKERAVINGDVILRSNLSDDFEKLKEFMKISSMIENIENLKGSHLDDIKPRTNVTNEDSQLNPEDSKGNCSIKKNKVRVFGNIKVRGNIITDEVDSLNFTNVKDKYMKKLTNLKFSEVKAINLIVKKLNNMSVDDEIIHYNTDNATHKFINKLSIDASLLLLDIRAQKINDINLHDTFPEVVNGSKRNVIKGRKRVRGNINIDSGLRTENINNISMAKLFGPSMYLSRSKPQNINVTVHLNSVKMDALKTEFINGINTSSLIDTNSEEIILQSSEIIFQKLFVHGNVISSQFQRGCRLPVINNTDAPLSFENAREYIAVNASGNISWNTKYNFDKGRIQKLFEEAVTFNGIQNITGSVKFNQQVTSNNVNAKKTVAGINMTHIISDAVLKNKPGQIISGEIVFIKDVTCSSANLQNEVIIPTVNSVNITELNEKVIRKNSKSDSNRLVTGYKRFENGFKTENLNTNGGSINGIQTRNIASLDNVLPPHLIFHQLEILKDLQTTKINRIDLDKFLSDRILLQHTFGEDLPLMNGDLIFNDHIIITGESVVEGLLNNIHTDHLIMKTPYPNDTTLHGCKTFENYLTADGEFNVDTINNKTISKVYNSSVLYGGTSSKFYAANVEFKGKVEMKSTSIHGSSFKVKDTELNFLNEKDESPINFLLGND